MIINKFRNGQWNSIIRKNETEKPNIIKFIWKQQQQRQHMLGDITNIGQQYSNSRSKTDTHTHTQEYFGVCNGIGHRCANNIVKH